MALGVFSSRVRPPSAQSVTLVLKASQSDDSWSRTIKLAREILNTLPENAVRKLFFLGNPTPFNPALLHTQQTNWRQANQHRISLITPVFESLSNNDETRILVIGSGCIFDLEDWEGAPILTRTLLVSLGNSLQCGRHLADELLNPTPQETLRHLQDPVQIVQLAGGGFMPIEWDNRAYRLALEQGKAVLRAEHSQNYALQLRFLARQPQEVRAFFTFASGRELETEIEFASEPHPLIAPVALTEEETCALRQAVHRQPFVCPQCGSQHNWHTLRCPNSIENYILEDWVYPSLRGSSENRFAVFQLTDSGASCRFHLGDVLWLGGNEVVIRHHSEARIYRYDESSDAWLLTSQGFQLYHQIGEDEYAVLL
jgi:predicted RNA-binding Zn-ribbon protein involved in translation (DUF1610 family)